MRAVKRKTSYWVVMAFAAGWLAACAGCGGSNLANVSGIVTFDGKPIEHGAIVFEPADHAGPVAGGTIENGAYRLEGKGGVSPGKKLVRIVASRPTGRKIEAGLPYPPGTMVDELKPFVPAAYNEKSTLTVDIPAGKVTKDFELTQQPGSR
jgi:hypothetical protein